jgi:hypothetical protein
MSPARSSRRSGRTSPKVSSTALVRVQPLSQTSDGVVSYTWVWYLLSVFVPFAGILIALFLYDQENWNVRKIGRNCLLIAFALWILLPILFFMMALLVTILALAGSVSDAVSPTD